MAAIMTVAKWPGTVDAVPAVVSNLLGGADVSQRICSVPTCSRPERQRGLCNAHRQRLAAGDLHLDLPIKQASTGTPTERFWAKVDRRGPDECWPWLAYCKENGYGQFFPVRGQPRYAHRFAYELLRAPIGDGLTVDHLCGVRHCVNPGHMELVTAGENSLRGGSPAALAARRDKCAHGHPYTPENTFIEAAGHRRCRTCRRAQQRTARGPKRDVQPVPSE